MIRKLMGALSSYDRISGLTLDRIAEGDGMITYAYHPDGQLARATWTGGARDPYPPSGASATDVETFEWDGLALIRRGDEQFMNEPHAGGGSPIASSKGTTYFNDLLGTTVGSKSGATYTAAALSAFGEPLPRSENAGASRQPNVSTSRHFFTGKPQVEGLGYAFLMRNYRANLAKWQTVDPLGYPDGWNALAYCGNGVTGSVDLWGCEHECVFPGEVDDLRHEITIDPLLAGALYNGMGYSLAIWWTCNHDFENTSISSHVQMADGCSETVYYHSLSGEDMYIGFSFKISEDSCVLLEKMSTAFEKVYLLTIKGKFYASLIYTKDSIVLRTEEPVLIGDIDVSYTHRVAREIFE